jgi:hypothetical protein
MSFEFAYTTRAVVHPTPFAELSVVEVVRAVDTSEGDLIPAGSHGTVVAVWDSGAAYEVEFAEPVVGLATVLPSFLKAA